MQNMMRGMQGMVNQPGMPGGGGMPPGGMGGLPPNFKMK
jgi:hypothetical protein